MCEPNEDCYKPVGTVETQYPKEKCVNCNDDPNCPEPTPLSYTPQACIKVKNGILFSCSATVDGCEKTVKIYNGENEVVFQGGYTAANEFISTQNDEVVLLAVEFILCPEDSQTESNPVCFEVYTESDEKFIRESCDCCNSDMRVSDSYVATSCEECAVINFEPLFDGRHDIDEVVVSETNPVTNGTLSAIGESKYLFKFCPADGFSGTTDFGFTIKDTKGNVSTEKTVYVEVKECPEPEVPCSETTVSVQIIDVNTDIPITDLSYPIGVFSPFSTSSGTGGKIGDAASYAEIISLLNDDTNKPENIVFSADGTGPNINVTGTCDFAPIKAGTLDGDVVKTLQEQVNNFASLYTLQQLQINYLMAHLFDCCAEPPAEDTTFAGTTIELCSEENQGRITYTLSLVAPGVTDFSVTQKILEVPTATPSVVSSSTPTNMIVPAIGNMRTEIANIANTNNKFKLQIQYTQSAIVKTGLLVFDLPHFAVGANICYDEIPVTFYPTSIGD